jgi:hypothetical protein
LVSRKLVIADDKVPELSRETSWEEGSEDRA